MRLWSSVRFLRKHYPRNQSDEPQQKDAPGRLGSSMLILETPRLILRPFRDSDLESFAAYRSDPEVERYQGWEAPYSVDKAAEFIAEMKHKQPAIQGEWYQLAIELIHSIHLIGVRPRLALRWPVNIRDMVMPPKPSHVCWTICSAISICIASWPLAMWKTLPRPACWSEWGCGVRGILSKTSGSKATGEASISMPCCRESGPFRKGKNWNYAKRT